MLPDKNTYTVTEITEILRHVVESEPTFQDCWIEGEISGLARPRSGHIYFKLKDDKSQIRLRNLSSSRHATDISPERRGRRFAARTPRYLPDAQRIPDHRRSDGALPVSARCNSRLNGSKSNLPTKDSSIPTTKNPYRRSLERLALSPPLPGLRYKTSSEC